MYVSIIKIVSPCMTRIKKEEKGESRVCKAHGKRTEHKVRIEKMGHVHKWHKFRIKVLTLFPWLHFYGRSVNVLTSCY